MQEKLHSIEEVHYGIHFVQKVHFCILLLTIEFIVTIFIVTMYII